MNKNLTFFKIEKSVKKEENEMMLKLMKKRLESKQFQQKMNNLKELMKMNDAEWNGYFRSRWNKDWENDEYPSLEEAIMGTVNLSNGSTGVMEETIEILKNNLFIPYERINEKKKMAWLKEVVAHGRAINAKAVIIKRKDIQPEKKESIKRFEDAVKNGENRQIVISELFAIWVTFKINEVLTPTMIENWGLSQKKCSVEYVL